MPIKVIEVLVFVCLAGFFGGMMDMIKDYPKSEKNWLWKLCAGTKYEPWYNGYHPIPFFELKGCKYRAGYVWLSDAWHMAKHFMLLSWALAVSVAFGIEWYYTIGMAWVYYWSEGLLFNAVYQRLKE